ncbi:MAG: hypothetical protein ACYTX0_50640, partial [Nostoc sp.]
LQAIQCRHLGDSRYPVGQKLSLCLDCTRCPTAQLNNTKMFNPLYCQSFTYPQWRHKSVCYWIEPHTLSFQGAACRKPLAINLIKPALFSYIMVTVNCRNYV